jgi:hypothetical protein
VTEPRDLRFSRRGFLAAASATAAAAGVLVTTNGAGATTLRSTATVPARFPKAVPAQSGSDDLDIAAFACTLEIVALHAYQAVLEAAQAGKLGDVPPAGAEYAQTAYDQHRVQLDKWNEILLGAGKEIVIYPDPQLQAVLDQRLPEVTDFGKAAMLARDLEEIAAATYLSVIPKISDDDAIQLAGSIQVIDAQHVAILNFVLGDYPVPDVFAKTDKAATPPAS